MGVDLLDMAPEEELARCCRSGSVLRVSELLEWGVKVDSMTTGSDFLTIACEHGQFEVAKVLLEAGAAPTQRHLILSVLSGQVRLADRVSDELFFAGVEVDFWIEGKPLLTQPGFLRSTSPAMLRWLLKQGCDPHQRDRNGRDAFKAAERDGVGPEIVEILRRAP